MRVDFPPDVAALLATCAKTYGLTRSETMRRIIRAAMDVGPALSAENTRQVAALASQVRMVGRNLSQLVHAIHAGRAVPMESALPVWEALTESVGEIDGELTRMTLAYGLRLRRAAHLPEAAKAREREGDQHLASPGRGCRGRKAGQPEDVTLISY